MTHASPEVVQALMAEMHREAEQLRLGRRISADRSRARRARKVAERNAAATRLRVLAPTSDWN